MSFPGQAMQRCWHLIDAKNQTVGRLASQVAAILRGKHKPTFLPNKDMGDHVVVINANHIHLTGKKWDEKLYRWHTGYPGGLKQRTAREMHQRKPTEVLKKAILGMLFPQCRLRHGYVEPRLKIYAGAEHPHKAQLPPTVEPLPPLPRSMRGATHFGFASVYAHPDSYQQQLPKAMDKRQVEWVSLDDDDDEDDDDEENYDNHDRTETDKTKDPNY